MTIAERGRKKRRFDATHMHTHARLTDCNQKPSEFSYYYDDDCVSKSCS